MQDPVQGNRRGTELLGKFRIGSPWIMSALGNGFTIYHGSPQELLWPAVSGGPLHFLARVLAGSGKEVVVLLGAETGSQLLALSSLKSMGARVEEATIDGSTGYKGTVTGLLTGYLQQKASGPPLLLRPPADARGGGGTGRPAPYTGISLSRRAHGLRYRGLHVRFSSPRKQQQPR